MESTFPLIHINLSHVNFKYLNTQALISYNKVLFFCNAIWVSAQIYMKQLHVLVLAVSKLVVLIWFRGKNIIDCTREHSKFLSEVASRISTFLLCFQNQKLQWDTGMLSALLSEKYPGTVGQHLDWLLNTFAYMCMGHSLLCCLWLS